MENTKPIAVLLVDDEDRFRVTTAATLKRRGFEVHAASSGEEAIEELQEKDIDVVVLDIKMPGMNGNDALHEIKKLKPDVEVVMLTGYGSMDSVMAGRREGVFAYLTKPCAIDFLALRLREAYAKKAGIVGKVRRVKDIMVPLSAFASTIREDQTVAEAVDTIFEMYAAAKGQAALHRFILVTDSRERPVGVISFTDLLVGLYSPYADVLNDSSRRAEFQDVNPPDYLGDFASMVRDMSRKRVRDLMKEKPPTISQNADLIEASNKLLSQKVQSLLVLDDHTPVGVLRDKDIFLEVAHIIKKREWEVKGPE